LLRIKLSQELNQLDPEEPSDRVLFLLPSLISQGIKRRNMPADYADKVIMYAKEGETSPVVYNMLLYMAISKKEYNQVFEIYDAMRSRGVMVNSATFAPLLVGK
jgi:pentatricopeptide repeat protein